MVSALTDEGLTHIGQREAGDPLTNAFDAMYLGQGNNGPLTTDDLSHMTAKIVDTLVSVDAGYPQKADSDIRNDGRGADVWTWRATYAEGAAFIASNAVVTNYASGAPIAAEPILVHTATVLAKRADQVMYLWINVSTAGAVTVVAHVEDGTPLVEQLAGWRPQHIALSGAPGASPVSNGVVQSKQTEGEQVWTAARLLNGSGGVMTRDDVLSVVLSVYKRSRERDWVLADEMVVDVLAAIPASPVRTDPRWRGTQGYTFAHAWVPPGAWGSARTRLEYLMTLASGDTRALVHEVEWASARSR